MGRTSDPERAIRRARVFALLIDGRSYREIARALGIDKDTVTADAKTLAGRLETWASDRKKRALAEAVATYERIKDEAWDGYIDECERERRWLDGDYDREHDAPDMDGGMHKEKKPPPFKVIKVSWLNTLNNAQSALSKLHGVEAPQKVALTDTDGKSTPIVFTISIDRTREAEPDA